MYYIRSASSVTCQPTFDNAGFSANIQPATLQQPLVLPDFKQYINPALIRRMSEILRIAVACSKNALAIAAINDPQAIITGTGLGCLYDTEKFLNNALTIEGGMLPPTAFIQSTHNTIAGQISLLLENRSYNMTHTQNTVSFERSLEDALLWLDEGLNNVLVGAADEAIPQLNAVFAALGLTHLNLTTGASFFVLSKEKGDAKAAVADVLVYRNAEETLPVADICAKNNLKASDIGLVLYAGLDNQVEAAVKAAFPQATATDYQQFCGVYATNVAFAMHLATDMIREGNARNVLLVNRLNPANTGLILVKAV